MKCDICIVYNHILQNQFNPSEDFIFVKDGNLNLLTQTRGTYVYYGKAYYLLYGILELCLVTLNTPIPTVSLVVLVIDASKLF